MAKNHEIRVKLSSDELETISIKAKRMGLEKSAFLRMLGLTADIEILGKRP